MLRFVLRRLGFIVGVSFGIVFFAFFGIKMADNSTSRSVGPQFIPTVRAAFQETVSYVGGLPAGKWGTMSVRVGRATKAVSVRDALADTYPKSIGLLFIALTLATLIGVPLGILAAVRRYSPLSLGTMTATLLGISLPSFTVAALLQIGEIYWFRTFGFRLVPVGGFGWDTHLIIPVLVLAARPVAHLARIAYMAFSDIFDQEYMRTADAKGLYRRFILRVHAVPNSAVPLLTGLAVSLRFSLGSLPVVEYFLGWPGIGAGLLEAITNHQAAAVAGMSLALGLTFMLINLLIDVLYRYADPRLRAQQL